MVPQPQQVETNDVAPSTPTQNMESDVMSPRTKKKVMLSPDIQSKCLPPLDDTPKEDIWYDNNELHRIQRENGYTVFMLEKGRKINENRYCPRGLESETETGKAEAEAKTKAAKAAVLQAQAKGIADPDLIANIYSDIASPCLEEARSNGVADQKAALE